MNRDEILARSQKENHGQDIVNLQIAKDSMKTGWIVVVCLLAVVSVAAGAFFVAWILELVKY